MPAVDQRLAPAGASEPVPADLLLALEQVTVWVGRVARQLAGEGRHLVIATRDPQQAQQAAVELGGDVTALPVGLDVTQADSPPLSRR